MATASRLAVIDLSQQPWEKLYQAAEFAVRQQNWIAAVPLLQQVLLQVPRHASAHHLLGKAWRATDQMGAALAAQQRSCELDPDLGWNWFAAGELLLELDRWPEAVEAFEQAQAVLPAEAWISEQLSTARWLQHCHGERLTNGIGPLTYNYWIKHHEPRLPSDSIALKVPFWCLEALGDGQQCWRALHSTSRVQPAQAPLGRSPWPTDGWLVLLSEGTTLRPGALQGVERWLAGGLPLQSDAQSTHLLRFSGQPLLIQPDLIYADEDRLNADGQRTDPWFKPGWTEESFWSSPWLYALSVWRISWLRDRQLPLPPEDPEGRWRWQLSALQKNPQICHCPYVLVHTGCPPKVSTESLKQHLTCQGERIQSVQPHLHLPGCFHLQWHLPKHWSCTVIIPTRDHAELLEQCLSSLWSSTEIARNNGLDLEILVVDNGSVESSTLALFQKWQQRIRVLPCDEPFNWSRLNNFAVAQAQGELLLLLNNDIESLESGWIEAMAAQAFRPAIGAVGAVLLYPDGTIQHAGVVVGINDSADHAYRHLPPDHDVHRGRSRLLTNWGAVTGACLMIRKELLERVGGFDEGLPVEFNDVDLCLRLSQLGYRCVIPEKVVLKHHESQSRVSKGSSTALSALRRVQSRWPGRLAAAHPWWPDQSERTCLDGRPSGLEGLGQ